MPEPIPFHKQYFLLKEYIKASNRPGHPWQTQNRLAQAACVRHAFLRAPCVAWPLLSPTFSLSFSLSMVHAIYTLFKVKDPWLESVL